MDYNDRRLLKEPLMDVICKYSDQCQPCDSTCPLLEKCYETETLSELLNTERRKDGRNI